LCLEGVTESGEHYSCLLAVLACGSETDALLRVRRTANAYHVGTSLTDDGVFASDHRPVFADVTLVH
jgi:hypothetical protein